MIAATRSGGSGTRHSGAVLVLGAALWVAALAPSRTAAAPAALESAHPAQDARAAALSPHRADAAHVAAQLPDRAAEGRAAAASPPTPEDAYDAARAAWWRGDYVAALEGLLELLDAPDAERYRERIAELTGEPFRTHEVAKDGRGLRFSPDGRLLAYALGTGANVRTHVLRAEPPFEAVLEVAGSSVVFGTDGGAPVIAYLRVEEDATLRAARDEVAKLALAGADGQKQLEAQERLRWLEAQRTHLLARDLATGRERALAPALIPLDLVFGPDPDRLLVLGIRREEPGPAQVHAVALASGASERITDESGHVADLHLSADGRHLVFTVSGRSPLPAMAGAAAEMPEDAFPHVVVQPVATGERRSHPGVAPALSADGSTLVFATRDGQDNVLVAVRLDGEAPAPPVAVHRTRDLVGPPVASPDGRLVAFHQRPDVSWHLYVVGRDGSGLRQVGGDIQHELFPRFLDGERILAVMGEFRHRRSHIYDLAGGERTRLFHNNTVRTIAPEYEWEPSPDGTRVLIAARRDGDTVRPEQGVYLVDLTRPVTVAELRQRLERQLVGERALRERGQALFAPIAAEVRRVVERVSTDRLLAYQEALYAFGSKHITMPGNRPAGEYIHETLASFGYEPEYQWLPPLEAHHPSTPSATSAPLRFEPMPGIRTANVVAVLPGTEYPEVVYVLSSHYDSVQQSPGADDNSSGTAVLLETARVLADAPQPATIVFAALTAEESGLLGAREFVRLARERGDRIAAVLNNDMLGFSRDGRLDNTIRYTNEGIRDIQHAAAIHFSDLITYDSRYVRGTDAAVFWEAYGDVTGGIGSYPVLHNPHYHQPTDRLETIDQELVTQVARATTAALMLLASSPSPIEGLQATPSGGGRVEVSWDRSPERDIVAYIVAHGPPADPWRHQHRTAAPAALLEGVRGGDLVCVRAINAAGLASWDWAQLRLP